MATTAQYGTALYGDSQYSVLLLNCSAGSYTLTGGAASLLYKHSVPANTGVYSLNGQDASLNWNQKLTADTGSYTITGGSASFSYNQVIYAGNWAFHITGQDAALLTSLRLNAAPGSYTLTGGAAFLLQTHVLNASAGAFAISGKDAILNVLQPNAGILVKGGIGKKKTPIQKSQREEVEAIVRRAFDEMDGTAAAEIVQEIQREIVPQIQRIDLHDYNVAISQANALILQAKLRLADYEAEADDEESLLMLL